jgi:hypothetical protein
LAVLVLTLPGIAAAKKASRTLPGSQTVEFFSALDQGQIAATVIPRDSRQLTVQVENKTDKPLSIRLPESIGAVPALAQMLNPGQFPGNNGWLDNPQQQPQGLGAPFGGPQMGNNVFQQGQQFNLPGGPLFNVLPGKIVKKKLPCVCLEFGKPDPRPRIPYRIERLENVSSKPEVRELLAVLGRGGCRQKTAQIAAWHLANDMSWEQLARLKHKLANGSTRPRFSAADLQLAKRLVGQLPSAKPPKPAESAGYRFAKR